MSYLETIGSKALERFGDDVDQVLERSRFLAPFPFRNGWLTREEAAANITKNENGYDLQIALPGFEKDAVKVKMENGMLVVSAAKTKREETNKDFIMREFYQEDMYRSFTLSDSIDEDRITAKLENGLLRVYLPLKKSSQQAIKSKAIALQ